MEDATYQIIVNDKGVHIFLCNKYIKTVTTNLFRRVTGYKIFTGHSFHMSKEILDGKLAQCNN